MALAQQGAGFRGNPSYTFEFYRRVTWPISMIQAFAYHNGVYEAPHNISISLTEYHNCYDGVGNSTGHAHCIRSYFKISISSKLSIGDF